MQLIQGCLACGMEEQARLSRQKQVIIRLALAATVGLAVSTAVGVSAGSTYAPVVGWIAARLRAPWFGGVFLGGGAALPLTLTWAKGRK